MSRRDQARRVQQAFVWVAAIPIVLALAAYWSATEVRIRIGWVTHTQAVLASLGDLMVLATSAQASGMRYVLTAHGADLDAYTAGAAKLQRQAEEVRVMMRDNPEQQRDVERLRPLLRALVAEQQETIRQRRAGNLAAALRHQREGRGEQILSGITEVVAQMQSEEKRLLVARMSEQRATERYLAPIFLAGIFFTLGLLYWASQLIQRYGQERDRAEEDVQQVNRNLEQQVALIDRMNRDLEQRVAARTAELEAANLDLRRSNEDLEHFAYVASHDLQEPLRMVGSYVGLLARRYTGKLDEDADKYIRFAVEGAKRMQALVHDLLVYSRAGTQALHLELVDMSEVFQEALLNLEAAVAESGAEIRASVLPAVLGDRLKLGSVLQNLIGNAIKFRRSNAVPEVKVAAAQYDGEWVFSVRDNGIGFDEKHRERIFLIFQRLHGIGKYPGTGIGLAICKRIVEGHGGRVWAESKPGEGSTFFFTLPAVARESLAQVTPQERSEH